MACDQGIFFVKYSFSFILLVSLMLILKRQNGRNTSNDKLLAWPSKNVYYLRGKSKSDVFFHKKKKRLLELQWNNHVTSMYVNLI